MGFMKRLRIEQKWWANHLICKSAIDTKNFESFKQQLMQTDTKLRSR
jgi:hypothetical protein